MSDLLDLIETMLEDVPSTLLLILPFVVVVGAFIQLATIGFMRWTEKKAWWPSASVHQKALAKNLGVPDEVLDEAALLEGWSFVLCLVIHHMVTAALLVPVVFWGWDAVGETGQLLFYFGILLELGFDVYDFSRQAILFFCPKVCCGFGKPVPAAFFIIVGVCHHQISILLIVPMLINYVSNPQFHQIAFWLVFAGGFSYATGSYKFTLDTSQLADFRAYKIVVLVQIAVIFYARMWVWFTEVYTLLATFYDDERMSFFWGGIFSAVLMTLFNFAMAADVAAAAAKWLPRDSPTTAEDMEAMELSLQAGSYVSLRSFSKTPDDKKGQLSQGPLEMS